MTTTLPAPRIDLDRTVILVDHYAEQARRSATVRSWAAFRRRVLRVNRQARFARAWGLR